MNGFVWFETLVPKSGFALEPAPSEHRITSSSMTFVPEVFEDKLGTPLKPGTERKVLVAKDPSKGYHLRFPLDTPSLFLQFAATDQSERAVIEFANQHGTLAPIEEPTLAQLPAMAGLLSVGQGKLEVVAPRQRMDRWCQRPDPDLSVWFLHARYVRWHVDFWKAIRNGDAALRRLVRRDGQHIRVMVHQFAGDDEPMEFNARDFAEDDLVAPAMVALCDVLSFRVSERMNLLVSHDPRTRHTSMRLVPSNLLAAVWYQFSQAVQGDYRPEQCETCGKAFIIAPGAGRSDKKHCTPNCRTRAFLARREKARAMRAKGKSIKQIAEHLGVETSSVKKWVSK